MPQLKVQSKATKKATFSDVKAAAKVGDAQFAYFAKYGKFPKHKSELQEFLRQVIVNTCSLFRQIDSWKKHKITFSDYKAGKYVPDYYGRDASLSHPHVHHIHLAMTKSLEKAWKRKSAIHQLYYRTTKINDPDNDYWLLYAYDDIDEKYLLLTILGPDAHNNDKWRSYLQNLYLHFVEPWILGKLECCE